MLDALRPFISRYAAILVAYVGGWLTVKYGVDLPPELRDVLKDTLSAVALFMVTYVTTHRLVDKKVNPADTASEHLAVEGKAEARAAKVAERTADRAAHFGAVDPMEEPIPGLAKIPAPEKGP